MFKNAPPRDPARYIRSKLRSTKEDVGFRNFALYPGFSRRLSFKPDYYAD